MALSTRLTGALGALGLGAALVLTGSGQALAAPAPAHSAASATTTGGSHLLVTFTRAATARSPKVTFGCSVTYPEVTDTFSNGEFSWSAAVSCSVALHMQGTTAFYQWGSSNAYAFGSSYNNTATSNQSTGAVYGIHTGQWGVNNNVDIFPPAGYTTTLSSGCYNVNASDIHCTSTSGPVTAG
ncbi:hypothetical protein POF50_031320 [Streptomyces sp. SL13]|uniref:Uncharacterized protein n=1 Tax=Streptantibioticus silvisoli TaxID=2705255 RepID=A0AA90H589_9ACTN|nr:hypothetical protein [Streptantibioticus silvisoli]MDI5967731.1 hypothetical protein [Streptantibioticus silvisoli]MDI5973779.1 hypothetical protein [Streptantibioticus silvisoli]